MLTEVWPGFDEFLLESRVNLNWAELLFPTYLGLFFLELKSIEFVMSLALYYIGNFEALKPCLKTTKSWVLFIFSLWSRMRLPVGNSFEVLKLNWVEPCIWSIVLIGVFHRWDIFLSLWLTYVTRPCLFSFNKWLSNSSLGAIDTLLILGSSFPVPSRV